MATLALSSVTQLPLVTWQVDMVPILEVRPQVDAMLEDTLSSSLRGNAMFKSTEKTNSSDMKHDPLCREIQLCFQLCGLDKLPPEVHLIITKMTFISCHFNDWDNIGKGTAQHLRIHVDVRMSAVNLYSAAYRTKFIYLFIKATEFLCNHAIYIAGIIHCG